MSRNASYIFAIVVAFLLIATGIYVYHGDTQMERAANNSGTTTQRFDANAAANQGSTPPGDARAVGGDRTK